jgi:hypothetical protein
LKYGKLYKEKSFRNIRGYKKRMNRKIVLLILMVYLLPLVVALDTKITIQSEPDADIVLKFLDLNTGRGIGSDFFEKGDEQGRVEVSFSSEDKLLRFSITVQKGGVFKPFNSGVNGSESNYAKFNMVEAGNEIIVNLNTNEPKLEYIGKEEIIEEEDVDESVVEETIEVVEEVVEEVVSEESSITGDVIGRGKNFNFRIVGYFVGLIIAIVIVVFVIMRLKKNKGKKSKSIVKIRDKDDVIDEDLELADAERRIKEAEIEIKDIRNKKYKLKQAEDALKKDKENLEKIRKEAGK